MDVFQLQKNVLLLKWKSVTLNFFPQNYTAWHNLYSVNEIPYRTEDQAFLKETKKNVITQEQRNRIPSVHQV